VKDKEKFADTLAAAEAYQFCVSNLFGKEDLQQLTALLKVLVQL